MEELYQDEEYLTAWLRLAHGKNLTPRVAQWLLAAVGQPETIFKASKATLRCAGASSQLIRVITHSRADPGRRLALTQRWLEQPNCHLVTYLDPRYPPQLRDIPAPPTLLYVRGDPDLLAYPAISMVGSRRSLAPSRSVSAELAAALANAAVTVVSGLAQGIDAAAHEGALSVGGATIAVTGTGLDRVYPARHAKLAERIAATGALVSEFPLGTPPIGRNFPQRNRIISGLSLAVVVVEAALRSGTLSTARHALEQGREVMALPGSVRNPLARGCHALLRAGATLVESADHILTEIAPQIDTDTLLAAGSTRNEPVGQTSADPSVQQLLALVGYAPVTTDSLIGQAGIPASQAVAALLQLELDGRISLDSGGRYTRC